MWDALPHVVQMLLAALSGGGVATVASKLIERRGAREESEIQRLREDFEKCEKRHGDCETKLLQLSERVRAVEASTPSYLARWVKAQDKKLLWLNDRAYMLMLAPLGWARGEVLDKDFTELLGKGSGEAIRIIDELDEMALRHPGEVQSTILQLHPSLPAMVIVKVAFVAEDGLLRYEGSAFVPNGLSDSMSMLRQRLAREAASRHLFQGDEDDGP